MVDVTAKEVSSRTAVARGFVRMKPSVVRSVRRLQNPKGNPLEVARLAGIAAAIDNDLGVVGVAPGARLWSVRVLDANGDGWVSDIIKGIDWVAANAAEIEVANMSLGGQGVSTAYRTAIQNSVAHG